MADLGASRAGDLDCLFSSQQGDLAGFSISVGPHQMCILIGVIIPFLYSFILHELRMDNLLFSPKSMNPLESHWD